MTSTTTPTSHEAEFEQLKREYQELQDKFEFLYYWLIRNDETVRILAAQAGGLHSAQTQTNEAFDHKWQALQVGTSSLMNPEHKENIQNTLHDWTGIDNEWYQGKDVLDAGCGDGRFSYAMCTLGANVTSIDQSEDAITCVKKHCSEYPTHKAHTWNLMETAKDDAKYDLVLSFGVVHCTGDTKKAIQHLSDVLHPGGWLVLMVYGYPRLDHPADFAYMSTKERRRQAIRHMDYDEAREYLLDELQDPMAVRGWFDATTPQVEDHYTYPQIANLMREAGITDIERLAPDIRNLCVRGRKK